MGGLHQPAPRNRDTILHKSLGPRASGRRPPLLKSVFIPDAYRALRGQPAGSGGSAPCRRQPEQQDFSVIGTDLGLACRRGKRQMVSIGPNTVRELVGAVSLARTKIYSAARIDLFEELGLRSLSPLLPLLFTTGTLNREPHTWRGKRASLGFGLQTARTGLRYRNPVIERTATSRVSKSFRGDLQLGKMAMPRGPRSEKRPADVIGAGRSAGVVGTARRKGGSG
jgi:hypothetical protein